MVGGESSGKFSAQLVANHQGIINPGCVTTLSLDRLCSENARVE
jgi:hypothetical protein